MMSIKAKTNLEIEEVAITGHAQPVLLRLYFPKVHASALPVVVYFHGGRFDSGSLEDATIAASTLAQNIPAAVVSVAYSLAPDYPFPAALEDGYCALQWVIAQGERKGMDASRIGVAGHDAGGNLATCLAAMARDRNEITISAQALLAPLLDPSMTRMGEGADWEMSQYSNCYRSYLPNVAQRLHPYAAPLESRRLYGLPLTLITSSKNDCLHIEAEKYAGALISSGIATEFIQYPDVTHDAIASDPKVLADIASFFRKRLHKPPISSAR